MKKKAEPKTIKTPISGQRVGYIRVSSEGQNADRQLEGIELDKTYTDKASGKNTGERPALKDALSYVREGDTLLVHSMDRLARNLQDLLAIVNDLTKRGVRVEFVKEHLTFSGDDAPMSKLLLGVIGSVAEFERTLIRERQREGIALAKKAGRYKGGKRSVNMDKVARAKERVKAGVPKVKVAKEFGVSRATLYTWLTL